MKTHRVVVMGVSAVLLSSFVESQAQAQQPFEIVSVNSGQVLDVPGFSTAEGTQIQQWPQNGGTNQQWLISEVYPNNGGCGVLIQSAYNGQVLEVPAFSTAQGKQIQQWPENGGTNQQWLIKTAPYSNNSFEIFSVNSGQVLDVPGYSTSQGTFIQQWPENDGTNQRWLLRPAPGGPDTTISVTGQHNQLGGYITTSGHSTPGTVIATGYMGVPNTKCETGPGGLTTVNPDGTFSFTDLVYITSTNINDASKYVTVLAWDASSGYVLAVGTVLASYWTSF